MPSPESDENVCRQCGALMPDSAAAEICQRCLLAVALDDPPPSNLSPSSAGWEPPSIERLQEMLPQYEISGILGRGGMGAVYRGRQTKLNRNVAIKILPETFVHGEDELNFAKRFEQEAQAMANLDHPAIVSVYDFGETPDDQLYFVMEFIDGMDIHQYLRHHGGKLTQEHALAITAHVLDALDYAHGRGIVHRDIKPANILLNQEGRVKIADFGLAKTLSSGEEESAPALTMTNVAVGTPDFVAPEALESGRTPDHRADLYAVGVMLYQMLTGTLPRGKFQLPSALVPELDPRLDGIIDRTLESNPDDRYGSASEIRSALDPIFTTPITKVEGGAEADADAAGPVAVAVSEEEAPVRPAGIPKPKKAETPKLPIYLGIGLVGLLAIGGLVAFLMRDPGSGDGEELAREGEPKEQDIGSGASPADVPPETPVTNPESSEPEVAADPGSIEPAPTETKTPPTEPAVAVKTDKPQAEPPPPPLLDPPGKPPGEADPAAGKPMPEPDLLAEIPGLKTRVEGYLAARQKQVGTLATNYLRGLDSRLNQAVDAGNLKAAKGFREEKQRVETLVTGIDENPEDLLAAVSNDPSLPDLPEGAPAEVATLRQIWTTERKKIRDTLSGQLQQSLKALEAQLTKGREFEKAETVLAYRESLIGGDSAVVANEPTPASQPDLPRATKDHPFENSFGMKFVPIPGAEVLFCIHEVRWKDYAAFASENSGISGAWKNQIHDEFNLAERPEDHPVVFVNWEEAKAFCEWLGQKEGRNYRLPTDREWSMAVGVERKEKWKRSDTPSSVVKDPDEFPWGREWPPPDEAGNFSDQNRKARAPSSRDSYIDGYDDGYPTTAPVMSFLPNRLGLFDLGGNVWEWVEDRYSATTDDRVMRGGSWIKSGPEDLLSSHRLRRSIEAHHPDCGFRVVLAPGVSDSPAGTITQSPEKPAGESENPFGWKPIPEEPFPLKRPERPTTPCRVMAWRLDGEPVDEAAFRAIFTGVPDDLGEVVDFEAYSSISKQLLPGDAFPLGIKPDGKLAAMKPLALLSGAELHDIVAVAIGRYVGAALRSDGRAIPLPFNRSAMRDAGVNLEEVNSWGNVARVQAGLSHLVGITGSGEFLGAGRNHTLQLEPPDGFRNGLISTASKGDNTWVVQASEGDFQVRRFGRNVGSNQIEEGDRFFIGPDFYLADHRGRLKWSNLDDGYSHGIEAIHGETPRNVVRLDHQGAFVDQQEVGVAAACEDGDRWRFWGDLKHLGDLDVKYCEERAAGAWKLFVVYPYVLALKPVANLKPDDWTGAPDQHTKTTPGRSPDPAKVFPLPIPLRSKVAGRLEVYRRDGKPVGSQPDDNGLANLPKDLGNNVVAISVGNVFKDHDAVAVALLEDGTVRVWSSGIATRPIEDPTLGLEEIVAVEAGTDGAAFLDERGRVFGAGGNFSGEKFVAQSIELPTPVVAIARSSVPGYALGTDGTVTMISRGTDRARVPADLPKATQLRAGWGGWALGVDGDWRAWYDRKEGEVIHQVSPKGEFVAADAFGSVLVWLTPDGGCFVADAQNATLSERPGARRLRGPLREMETGPNLFVTGDDQGGWFVVREEDKDDNGHIEESLKGCSAIGCSHVYVFGIRPVGK